MSRAAVGQFLNITCSISRTSPSNYTIEWTLTNSTGATNTLTETGETLVLADITEEQFGTYTCTATNSADLSGSANTTIEEECEPLTVVDYRAVCYCLNPVQFHRQSV